MKRFITALSLIAFAIGFAIISLFYINSSCDTVTKQLDESIKTALKDEQTQTRENLEKTLYEWETRDDFLNIILGQGETSGVKGYLTSALHFAVMGDTKTAIEHISWAKVELARIKNSNTPSLSTIL